MFKPIRSLLSPGEGGSVITEPEESSQEEELSKTTDEILESLGLGSDDSKPADDKNKKPESKSFDP